VKSDIYELLIDNI